MGGAECSLHAAPSTGPDRIAGAVHACSVKAAIAIAPFLRRSARSRRCTIECCLSLKVAGWIAASRRTNASAANCGSAASQLSIVARCGSSLEGMRIRFLYRRLRTRCVARTSPAEAAVPSHRTKATGSAADAAHVTGG